MDDAWESSQDEKGFYIHINSDSSVEPVMNVYTEHDQTEHSTHGLVDAMCNFFFNNKSV